MIALSLKLHNLLTCRVGCKRLSKYFSSATHPFSSRGTTTPTGQGRNASEFMLMFRWITYHIRQVGKRLFHHLQGHTFDVRHRHLHRHLLPVIVDQSVKQLIVEARSAPSSPTRSPPTSSSSAYIIELRPGNWSRSSMLKRNRLSRMTVRMLNHGFNSLRGNHRTICICQSCLK